MHVLLCPGAVLVLSDSFCRVSACMCPRKIPLSNPAAAFRVQHSSLQFSAFLHCHGLRKDWELGVLCVCVCLLCFNTTSNFTIR